MTRPHALLMAGVLLVFYCNGFVLGAPAALLLMWALLGLLVLVGFLRHAGHGPAGRVQWSAVALAALAALGVLALSRGAAASVVLATALVGAVGGALEAAGRSSQRWQGVAAPVYCGAFAGMTSELVLGHPAWVLLAGGLAGLVLSVLSESWNGIGGKLGTTAFLAVLGVMGLAMAAGALGSGASLHAFTPVERGLLLILSLLSPLLTHALSYRCGLGVVLGSALPSLLVAILLAVLPAALKPASVPLSAAWLGASFVGMTAPERIAPHPLPLLLAMGLLFALLDAAFEPRLSGIGGDLGATAAVSVFAVLGARTLVQGPR
ncbi:MAG: hypothetical protein R6W06_02175 [Prochlorococcaceae cyanobacterium]